MIGSNLVVPHPTFLDSARALQAQELGDVAHQALKLAQLMSNEVSGYSEKLEPSWAYGAEFALLAYGAMCCYEHQDRAGRHDKMVTDAVKQMFAVLEAVDMLDHSNVIHRHRDRIPFHVITWFDPSWMGSAPLHERHRQYLFRRYPALYPTFGPEQLDVEGPQGIDLPPNDGNWSRIRKIDTGIAWPLLR